MADSAAESEDALWLAAGGPLQCLYFRSYALSRITYDAEKSAPPDAKTRTAILNSACRAAYMAALSRAPLADGTTAASLVSAAWALHLLGALRRCNQSLLPAWAGELAKRALVVAEASLEASSSGHVFEPWAECLNAKDRATISLALPRKPRVGGLISAGRSTSSRRPSRRSSRPCRSPSLTPRWRAARRKSLMLFRGSTGGGITTFDASPAQRRKLLLLGSTPWCLANSR